MSAYILGVYWFVYIIFEIYKMIISNYKGKNDNVVDSLFSIVNELHWES